MSGKKLIFIPSGRLGNAIFRYMACAVVNIINPSLEYTLLSDADADADFLVNLKKFTFYPGLDHEGDDFYKTANIATMQSEASRDNSIWGYNTLGFFKHTIDPAELTSNRYINKENGQGIYIKNTITLTDDNFFNNFYKNFKCFDVMMDGFFQFGNIYLKYKPQILNYMHAHKNEHYILSNTNEKYLMRDLIEDIELPADKHYDIAIHIRLGDFNGRLDYIELDYYLQLFATIDFTGLKVCLLYEESTDPVDKTYIAACIDWFQTHNVPLRIESNSLLVDFNIMKQAKTLVCSMSTLAWTAAYLSTHLLCCYMPNYNFSQIPERRNFFFHKPIPQTILYPVKTTPAALARIKSYIVTLPEYAERLARLDGLNHKLSLIGLDNIIYNGVHGKDIRISAPADSLSPIKHITWNNNSYFYDTRVRLNGQPMTRGELGCAWSHLNLLRKLVEEASSESDYYLILEDDVELVKPIDEFYQLLAHLPADLDMCHLAKSDWYPFVKTKQVNAYFYECEKAFFNKTTAYLVSAKGARKIIDYTTNSINVPIDDLFNMIYRLIPDFRYYVPSSYFFKEQANVMSTIKAIDNI